MSKMSKIEFKNIVEIGYMDIQRKTIIISPNTKEWCKRPYPGRPHGCPNVEKCHSYALPSLSTLFSIYNKYTLVCAELDFKKYQSLRKKDHPGWTKKQLKNLLYWQGAVKSILKQELERLSKINGPDIYVLGCGSKFSLSFQKDVYSMELMGINVFSTLRKNGIKLEVHPEEKVKLCALIMSKNHLKTEQPKMVDLYAFIGGGNCV